MRGYTLFELLIVLAIIAFAATMTPAAFNAVRPGFVLDKVSGEIARELRLARSHAIVENTTALLTIEEKDGRFRIAPAGDWIDVPKNIIIAVNDRALTDHGDKRLTFYPDGSASGVDITLAGEKSGRLVRTSLNGKTTVTKIAD